MDLPGAPQRTEWAYLAALIDRSGTFAAAENSSTIGIKVSAPPELQAWLTLRFGGRAYSRAWVLQRQADVRYVATGVLPYLVLKREAGRAIAELLDFMATRSSYHGTPDWRAERNRLKAEVRRHLSPAASAARAEPARAATRSAPR